MKSMALWLPGLLLSAIAAPALALPSLTTTPAAGVTSLPLDGEGTAMTRIIKIADLALSTDNALGFTVHVSSGAIAKTGGTDINFQVVTVPNEAAAPQAGDFSVPSGSNYTYATSAAGSNDRDLYILYTPATLQDPGNYSSTINVWVVDN